MPEPESAREPDDRACPAATPDSVPARIPDLVLGDPAVPTDDTPTVISKSPPAQALLINSGEVLNGSLRGRRLAHFELLEPIGVGGMAAVMRARDTQLDRTVALKILPPEMAHEQDAIQRFHQEARAAAKLDHENIARVFFCGEDQKLHFIAFEFVEGENLRTILERRGRLPVAEAIHYMLQIAAGLDHAASRGVVHRDIKPSNIIITPTGRAKLVDMGLARHLGTPSDKGLTHSGVTLGTFDYISPEQALEPRDADVRSDIYSLGCTFYHMLTGQPPVPEGTAAKKLHHHQHVPPLDPRVLNPDIPDAVAAILARMMAKEPKDRYQRPEHLVAHLLQVGQELGVAPEVPEGGVLMVDAPLPSPPQNRVGLLAAVAVGGLVALLVLLSLLPAEPGPAASLLSAPRDTSHMGPSGPASKPPDVVQAPVTPAPQMVSSEVELRKALSTKKAHGTIVVADDITLGSGGLKIAPQSGEALVLEAADARKPAVLDLTYQPMSRTKPWAGLVVDSPKANITFRNLQFLLHLGQTPEALVAAVAVHKAQQVIFQRCIFIQEAPVEKFLEHPSKMPAASVAVDGTTSPVRLEECFFVSGQSAVMVNGAGHVDALNCAFGPHGALFHLRGPSSSFASGAVLQNCSAFVVHGPAFRLDGDGQWSVSAKQCIFSSPEPGPTFKQADTPDLLRQTSERVQLHYADQRTCYHGLNVFWAKKFNDLLTDWIAFRTAVDLPGVDAGCIYLPRGKESPWAAADPLALLREAPEPTDEKNRAAFRVNPNLPQLRQDDSGDLASKVIGIQKAVFGEYTQRLPAPRPAPFVAQQSKQKKRIVDPKAEGGGETYRTLKAALDDAKRGDLILIKHTGPLLTDPARLESGQDVIVRPYEGCHPILVLNAGKAESALFKVADAALRLEGLELELSPDVKELKSQAVVALAEGGRCEFKDCLISLKGLAGLPRCVVLLEAGDGKAMPATEPRPTPRVSFVNCLVRGEGDALRIPQSRPIEIQAMNLQAALDGCFLTVTGSLGESAVQGEAKLDLKHVTTYLTGPLLLLEDKRAGLGLVLTQVNAHDCLFAAASAGKSLVHIDGLEGRERLKGVFNWSGDHNWYSGFEDLLDQQPPAMLNLPPLRFDPLDWGMNYRDNAEARSHFSKLKLDLGDLPMSQLVPQQLRPRAPEAPDYGADAAALTEQLGLSATAAEESSSRDNKE
jgi:predicted Ser/Thr protein kinase